MRSLTVERPSGGRARQAQPRKAGRTPRAAAGRKAESAGRPALLRRPVIWLAGASLILAALVMLAVSGVVGRTVRTVKGAVAATSADAGFGVYEIRINGNRRVPTDTIFAALGLSPGQSIFGVDLPAARARILALDWIASADVVRRYPGSISVTVVEKRPFALWQMPSSANGGGLAVVERSGAVITTQGVDSFVRLPKLVGDGAPAHAGDLVDAVMTHRAVSARIAAYERVSDRRWNLILTDGVVVKLPESDWQPQLDALENLIVDKGILEKNVAEIDLREPAHYFFVLKGGEQKNVDRSKET